MANKIKTQIDQLVKILSTWLLKTKNWLTVKRAAIIVSTVLVLALVLRFVAPYGKVSTYNFVSVLPGAETFLSLNKTDNKLEMGGVILKNKTTRFSLTNQKNLKTINVHLAYKPGQREIKLGVRGDESNPFVYKSLFFDPINSLAWNKVSQNGLTLYQKNKQFETVAAFLNQMPTDKKIGIYQVDTNQLVPMIYPKMRPGKTVVTTPIRGNTSAYILVNGGDLNIKVSKQDMNLYDGADVLDLSLTLNGIKIRDARIKDDGFADKSKSQTAVQGATISLPKAKPGVYKLDFKFDSNSNDAVVTKIEVNQPKVVFGGSVLTWNGAAATFYTASTKITTSTSWPESIQNLKIDDKADLPIKDIKNKFSLDMAKAVKGKPANELYKIFSPKGNINFGTASYFSFSKESYFDPQTIKAQVLTSSDNQVDVEKNFDFILTTLVPAKEENYWLNSNLQLNPGDYQLKGDKIFFSLEIPDLDKQGGSLEIGGMTISLISK